MILQVIDGFVGRFLTLSSLYVDMNTEVFTEWKKRELLCREINALHMHVVERIIGVYVAAWDLI